MKRSGILPHQCDTGAMWFCDLFEKTQLAEHVRHTLELDVIEYAADVRAAAWLLQLLCHAGVWPADRLADDRRLAAAKLRRMIELELESDVREALAAELRAIQAD